MIAEYLQRQIVELTYGGLVGQESAGLVQRRLTLPVESGPAFLPLA